MEMGVFCAQRADYHSGSVGTAIVHDQDVELKVPPGRKDPDGPDQHPDIFRLVVRRNDHHGPRDHAQGRLM
jgi:hypothetical protein